MKTRCKNLLIASAVGLAVVVGNGAAMAQMNIVNHGDGKHNTHVRYPGDTQIKQGNYQQKRGKKVPYVEQCRWVFAKKPNATGYGLTQVCQRYTLDNTQR